MEITKSKMKRSFLKIQKTMHTANKELQAFWGLCEQYYGPENYSDHDEDEIIDHVDYGGGMLSFERFDEIMTNINTKPTDEI